MATISPETSDNAKKLNIDSLADKTRVYALASELGVNSSQMQSMLKDAGIEKKTSSSSVTRDEVRTLVNGLSAPTRSARKTTKNAPKKSPAKTTAKKSSAKKTQAKKTQATKSTAKKAAAKRTQDTESSTQDSETQTLRKRVHKRTIRRVVGREKPVTLEELEAQDGQGTKRSESTNSADSKTEKKTRSATRGKRGSQRGKGAQAASAENGSTPEAEVTQIDEPKALKGSTRLESQRRWRQEQRKESRTHIVSESEFLSRRESVERLMVVREAERFDHEGTTTQVGVLEDGILVEHFVTSGTAQSIVGNIYLGRVQNVLASMEAAFIDIGTGRNAVLYAGEIDWRNPEYKGKGRKIERILKNGDQVLVQVVKDPVGHKGARLTNRISFAGRYLVYVPAGVNAGISRKLPANERRRLKDILKRVVPGDGGAIIRTAAERVPEEEIAADVDQLHNQWLEIERKTAQAKSRKGSKPITMHEEPNLLLKVIRDIFTEDFDAMVVQGIQPWEIVQEYLPNLAPELQSRVHRYEPSEHDGQDIFEHYTVNEQLAKALSRKVWLPSGGTLVFDRTEAMTVIDVNTGSFTGSSGNLEETITENNLEAAEEIVRQMRLRDIGGMIVVDFIDMVLPENQDLVLRRLTEALGRDRTQHRVSEVTSLGLVQMTRKRLGTSLLETYGTECEVCDGRGIIVHTDPVESSEGEDIEPERSAEAEQKIAKTAKRQLDDVQEGESGQRKSRGRRHKIAKRTRNDSQGDTKNDAKGQSKSGGGNKDRAERSEKKDSGRNKATGRRRTVRKTTSASAPHSKPAVQHEESTPVGHKTRRRRRTVRR